MKPEAVALLRDAGVHGAPRPATVRGPKGAGMSEQLCQSGNGPRHRSDRLRYPHDGLPAVRTLLAVRTCRWRVGYDCHVQSTFLVFDSRIPGQRGPSICL